MLGDHSGCVVQSMNCLRLLERRDHGFESHSRHGCQYVRLFYVCVVLCVGGGLSAGWSLVSPTVCKKIWNWRRGPGPTKSCRAIDEWNEWVMMLRCCSAVPPGYIAGDLYTLHFERIKCKSCHKFNKASHQVLLYHVTQCYVPEGHNLNTYCHESLTSHTFIFWLMLVTDV
jgi:hypothetical protein